MHFTHGILLCAASVLLLACTDEAPKKSVKDRKADRIAQAERAVNVTPTPRTYRIDNNELKVIEIPVKDSWGFIDIQRCFVWRDSDLKSSSINCPSGASEPVMSKVE